MPDDISDTAPDWGMDSDARVWIGGHCQGAKRIVVAGLIHTARPPEGPIDAAFLAPLTVDECFYFARKIRPRLVPGGSIWVVYARGDSSLPGEFQGSFLELQAAFGTLGFCHCTKKSLGQNYDSAGFSPDATTSHNPAL